MIRNKTEERKRRLFTKILDQAFKKEGEKGLNCSPIESKALLDIVKEVDMPYLYDNQDKGNPSPYLVSFESFSEKVRRKLIKSKSSDK